VEQTASGNGTAGSTDLVIFFPSLALLAGKGVQKETLSTEGWAAIILNLVHAKKLLGALEKLHISSPPLLEAEVDSYGCGERQQVFQCP
jgi:hypothetical protein